ncbi:MAG: EscU/YscU/HrcU family type III secretion system export apparatus switch protein [candidate division WS1 bacterium]|jgi:flagellar biosynthetic protein FlhB|nr:EscU/YscU/HrcU family type III secretion system export apparatus switch protein [candidate division WS1 bacterium]
MASEERTEQASPRRRREAREKGQVATSVDLSRALGLLAIYLAWRFAGAGMLARMLGATEEWLALPDPEQVDRAFALALFAQTLPVLTAVLAPVMLAAMIGSTIAACAQTQGLVSLAAVKPDWSRLNPANGIKRLIGLRGLVAAGKSILKVLAVSLVAAWVLHSHLDEVLLMSVMQLRPMMAVLVSIAGELIVKCMGLLLVIGAADYAYEWWDQEKRLRMTRTELKRELRDQDGDPHIRSARDRLRRALLTQGILAEMPQADVVITNPTHFAVALRYEPDKAPAPRVVARGQRAVAREIIRLARTWGVPVVENPPVARSLFASCKLGDLVPEALFAVVAEIFAAVYRRQRSRGRRL